MKINKIPLKKILMVVFFLVIAALAGFFLQILHQLPNVEVINTYLPSESTVLFANDGKVLARLHQEENRQIVPLSKISPYLQKCVIAAEDPKFYQHHGFDFSGIVRAGVKNLIYGKIVEGGSTITQQLARNLFLTRKKTISRKVAEILLSLQIERRYTKEEIMELYLNQVYLGHNAYGVESAANLYFGKSAAELDLAESAMLAGIIRGPELYSPYRNFKGAKIRQLYVLNRAFDLNLVSEQGARIAAAENLEFSPQNLKSLGDSAQYFISCVIQQLFDKFGEEAVYRGGLKVFTTIDPIMQAAAETVVDEYQDEGGKKYNFSQVALVSLDPRTGYIKAMVGGSDFKKSKFNRVTQAKRQPGSAFKPFVYTAAMEKGISPDIILMDTPTTFDVYPNRWNPEGTWAPKNFDKKFHGAVTLRYALEKSLNIPSVKLLQQVGIPNAIDVAQRMGIASHLEPGLALALGVSEVTLLELTSAYGAFADNGIHVNPVTIVKVENRDGVELYKHSVIEQRALDPNIAAVMIDIMKGVLQRGTGVRGRIDRPAAAKTGTTEDFKDAWFVGFVPQLVTGIWVGNDDNQPMQGIAEVAICPRIWKSYNEIVLAGQPVIDFPKPQGLIRVKVCKDSGKLAGEYCPAESQRWATFWKKDAPTETCDIHKSGIIPTGEGAIENEENQ